MCLRNASADSKAELVGLLPAKDVTHRPPHAARKASSRNAMAPRIGARAGSRVSATAAALVGVALACIVGSEHEMIRGPRTRPFGRSLRRYFGSFRRASSFDPEPVIPDDQVDAYNRDGFVVISGLLDADELNGLVGAGEALVSEHVEKLGGKPKNGNFQVHEFGPLMNDERFRNVALHSRLPRAAAELMQLDRQTQNLRVLKDVFLAKGHESSSSCGWHVDDQLFWPAAYELPVSEVDQSGINAWIALDDMPVEHGGSMAVSPGSHAERLPWRDEALAALNFRDDLGNGISKSDLFEMIQSGKVDSCGLEKVAPHVYDDIELTKREFSFKRGDVIFMNRWLFHKSTDLTDEGRLALQAVHGTMLKRYSVRYATGSSSLPGGFMTEMSVLASDGQNLGKTLNDVKGDWYPQCWPEAEAGVDARIDSLNNNEMPIAKQKLGAIMAEVMSLFQSR